MKFEEGDVEIGLITGKGEDVALTVCVEESHAVSLFNFERLLEFSFLQLIQVVCRFLVCIVYLLNSGVIWYGMCGNKQPQLVRQNNWPKHGSVSKTNSPSSRLRKRNHIVLVEFSHYGNCLQQFTAFRIKLPYLKAITCGRLRIVVNCICQSDPCFSSTEKFPCHLSALDNTLHWRLVRVCRYIWCHS